MGIFNLFKKKETDSEKGWRVGGMEDFMTLIRVYYQAVMASQLGISNLAALPDLRIFKQTLHVPTQNNKLGLGEKNRCKIMPQVILRAPLIYIASYLQMTPETLSRVRTAVLKK